ALGHILGHAPLGIFHSHPGNHAALRVFPDVPNFVGDIHVPMNSGGAAKVRASSTGLDQQRYLSWGVALVVAEVVEDLELGAVEFLRPVTFFAGLLDRPEVADRSRNRPGIDVTEHRVNL